jgi:electron transfer DM13
MRTLYRRSLASLPRSSFIVPTVAIAGGLAFFAWKPGVALSTLASPRALGFAAALGILTIALGWALPRLGRGFALTALAQSVPVAIAFVVAVLPSFRTVNVNEPLPGVPVAEATADTSTAAADRPITTLTLARSEFNGIHHRATGTAVLIRLSNGTHVVRLERLDVESGPDYFVFIVPGVGHERPDGGTRLGHLHGNRGNQNYPVPVRVAPTRPLTVLIWCRAFAVPVAAATLR